MKNKSTVFADTSRLARKSPGEWIPWPEKYQYDVAEMRRDTIIAGGYVAFPRGCYAAEIRGGDLWVKYIRQDTPVTSGYKIMICDTSSS